MEKTRHLHHQAKGLKLKQQVRNVPVELQHTLPPPPTPPNPPLQRGGIGGGKIMFLLRGPIMECSHRRRPTVNTLQRAGDAKTCTSGQSSRWTGWFPFDDASQSVSVMPPISDRRRLQTRHQTQDRRAKKKSVPDHFILNGSADRQTEGRTDRQQQLGLAIGERCGYPVPNTSTLH